MVLLDSLIRRDLDQASLCANLDSPTLGNDGKITVLATTATLATKSELSGQIRYELWALDANETVVDGVTLEDVTERASDDKWDTRVLDRSRGLLTR